MFIINAIRPLSSGDFSSDTAGGRLKVKSVNDNEAGYGKCWFDKGGVKKQNKKSKQIKPP